MLCEYRLFGVCCTQSILGSGMLLGCSITYHANENQSEGEIRTNDEGETIEKQKQKSKCQGIFRQYLHYQRLNAINNAHIRLLVL